MLWMRDRSGRSGRRRGSQKPGTAADAAAAGDTRSLGTRPSLGVTLSWAKAGPTPKQATDSARSNVPRKKARMKYQETAVSDCIAHVPRSLRLHRPSGSAEKSRG